MLNQYYYFFIGNYKNFLWKVSLRSDQFSSVFARENKGKDIYISFLSLSSLLVSTEYWIQPLIMYCRILQTCFFPFKTWISACTIYALLCIGVPASTLTLKRSCSCWPRPVNLISKCQITTSLNSSCSTSCQRANVWFLVGVNWVRCLWLDISYFFQCCIWCFRGNTFLVKAQCL